MKNPLATLAAVVALALLALVALRPQAATTPSLITTTGTAQVHAVPDLADLSFEVEVRHADVASARQRQAERVARLLALLRAAGVPEAELRTSQAQVSSHYQDGDQASAQLKFYRVSQAIGCTLHEVTKVPEVTAAALEAGASGVAEVVLRTSQDRKLRDEVRVQAIRAAQDKARLLAATLGGQIGKPFTITEEPRRDWGPGLSANSVNRSASGSFGDGALPSFAPGTIVLDASVTVSFALK